MTTITRTLISLALGAGLAIIGAQTIAQTAQKQSHPAEVQYKMLATAYRALSACPNLIEEWELSELRSYFNGVSGALRQLSGGEIPPAYQRTAMVEGASTDCHDPQMQKYAAGFRAEAHKSWKARYNIVTNLKDCRAILDQGEGVLKDVEALNRNLSMQIPDDPGTKEQIRQEAIRIEKTMASGCAQSLQSQQGDGLPVLNVRVNEVFSPISLAERRAEEKRIERRFDLNNGYTLGLGDTAMTGQFGRTTSVLAIRSYDPDINEETTGRVIVGKAACGDYSAGTNPLTAPTLCSLVVGKDGGIGMTTTRNGITQEYKGNAVLRIYNPTDSSVILTLNPVKRDNVPLLLQYKASGITYFENVVEQIKLLHPLMQLNVSLIDENGNEISLVKAGEGQAYPQTVAVSDIRQAHAFSYMNTADDLTINGITKSFYERRRKALKDKKK